MLSILFSVLCHIINGIEIWREHTSVLCTVINGILRYDENLLGFNCVRVCNIWSITYYWWTFMTANKQNNMAGRSGVARIWFSVLFNAICYRLFMNMFEIFSEFWSSVFVNRCLRHIIQIRWKDRKAHVEHLVIYTNFTGTIYICFQHVPITNVITLLKYFSVDSGILVVSNMPYHGNNS